MSFNLKSGNTTPFKQMGSSPVKQDYVKDIYDPKWNPKGTKDFSGKTIRTTKELAKVSTTPKTNVKQAVNLNSQLAKNKQLKSKVTKKVAGKVAGKVASRFLGPVGVALTLKDAYGTYKDVKKGKGIKESLKKNFLGIE